MPQHFSWHPGFHLCPTLSPGCLFSRIDPILALPWQTGRPISPPRQERRQRPAPIPGDPNLFPARREWHLGAVGRAPRLGKGKERAAGSLPAAVLPPAARGRPPQQVSCHLRAAPPGRAWHSRTGGPAGRRAGGPAGRRAAEFADSKARRRRRRAHTSAAPRSQLT